MSFKPAAEAFARVKVTGVREILAVFDNVIAAMDRAEVLEKIVKKAAEPVRHDYAIIASRHDQTGNLAKSTTIKTKKYKYAAVAIAGPRQTGKMGATNDVPSGNHSWLFEFGSHGARTPGTAKKKAYINVHKSINGKMTIHRRLEDADRFHRRSSGYYFLMSSFLEPTRLARRGKGYSHDFLPAGANGNSKIHPFTLHPGQTYGAMPAYHVMEDVILANRKEVSDLLRSGLIDAVNTHLLKSLSGTP
jgi:hypothetical protein